MFEFTMISRGLYFHSSLPLFVLSFLHYVLPRTAKNHLSPLPCLLDADMQKAIYMAYIPAEKLSP